MKWTFDFKLKAELSNLDPPPSEVGGNYNEILKENFSFFRNDDLKTCS